MFFIGDVDMLCLFIFFWGGGVTTGLDFKIVSDMKHEMWRMSLMNDFNSD